MHFSVRLYSTKSFKPLGTLKYHGQSVYEVAFAHGSLTLGQPPQPSIGSDDAVAETVAGTDDQEDDWWEETDSERRCRWLVTAGKEGRVAFWLLDKFEKGW
jgi:ASTRA-associated protein 1